MRTVILEQDPDGLWEIFHELVKAKPAIHGRCPWFFANRIELMERIEQPFGVLVVFEEDPGILASIRVCAGRVPMIVVSSRHDILPTADDLLVIPPEHLGRCSEAITAFILGGVSTTA